MPTPHRAARSTITKEREQVLDFSYPMFSAGLEVMTTRRGSSPDWTSELASFITAGVGRYLMVLLAALIIAGHLVWLATRRPQLSSRLLDRPHHHLYRRAQHQRRLPATGLRPGRCHRLR